jgi:signal peptidase I
MLKLLPPPLRSIVEVLLTLLVAVAIAYLAQAYVIKPYRVPSGSMEQTLLPGDRVLADRLTLDFRDPHRYEIVVFHPPACRAGFGDPSQGHVCTTQDMSKRTGPSATTYIKRVIGIPGDTLFTRDGHVWAQHAGGKPFRLNDSFTFQGPGPTVARIAVPKGMYFMMGDNRGDSQDSRVWGLEPRGDIIGIARARYWPLDRLGLL